MHELLGQIECCIETSTNAQAQLLQRGSTCGAALAAADLGQLSNVLFVNQSWLARLHIIDVVSKKQQATEW